MRQKHLDLGLALLIALLNVCWAFLPANLLFIQVVRVLLALPLVLFLPGYTLTQIAFYRRSPDFVFLLALWPGLSIAVAIIGGLALNTLPSGLQASSWAIFLALVTTAFALIAGILRNTVPPSPPIPDQREYFTLFHLPFHRVLLFSMTLAIVTFSYVYAAWGEAQQPHPGFTQMWLLPTTQPTTECVVHLGFSNFEGKTMTYRATVLVGKEQQYSWSPVVLVAQGTWDQQVTIHPTATQKTLVAAQLYRQDTPQKPYRQVHLTLTHCKS